MNASILQCAAVTLVVGSGCASSPREQRPQSQAAAVERQACGGTFAVEVDPRIISPEIITDVSPLTVGQPASKLALQEHIVGARLGFAALPGLTPEWIERTLECHASRVLLRRAQPVPNDPYWLPDSWVAVSVESRGDSFLVTLRGESPEAGGKILEHAQAFAGAR